MQIPTAVECFKCDGNLTNQRIWSRSNLEVAEIEYCNDKF